MGGIASSPAILSLSVGSHLINASYGGDTNFSASYNITLTQQVNQASTTTSIQSSLNPSVYGQPVTFTATVNATAPGAGTPTGTVIFRDGPTVLGTGSLSGGIATSPAILSLSAGSHSINASYGGDANFSASYNNTLTQQVNQASTTTSIVSSNNPSVFGQPVIFTATVNVTAPGAGTPTGTVQFLDGATLIGSGSLTGGIASSPAISSLSAGSHSINASYGGDANFTASYNTLSQQVNQASTATSIVSSINPSVFGQPVIFTATVNVTAPGAGTPTGTVQFFDGATLIGSGSLLGGIASSPAISSLSAGSHSINASYGGDANFSASYNNTLTQQVNQASTATSIVSSINPSVFGQPVTFTAIVNATAPGAGTPTGAVQFFDGATLIGSGSLTGGIASSPAISSLSVGSHLINASYGGDTNFSASYNNTLPQQVNQASTATSLVSSINPSVFGQPITFTATVNATAPGVGTPMGTVTFRDGPTVLGTGTLAGGIASSPAISSLSAGSHSINASYGGDANFSASYNNTLSQQVNQASTATSIVSSINPSVFGQPVTFTAIVNATAPGAGTPTGTVTFRDGPTVLGTGSLSGGIASSPAISSLSAGSHSINVSYGGEANFSASYNNTLSQQVNQASTTSSIVSSVNPSVFGQPITFTATVNVTAPGAGTPTGTVTFRDGPTVLGTGTLAGGIASSPAISSLSAGSHSINASYGGDPNFSASYNTLSQQVNQASTTTSIKSSLNPSVFGQPVIFTATVNATVPGAGTPTGTVQFFDGATLIGSGSLLGGIASSPAISSLSAGSHSINASYGGDANFTASYNTLSQQVNQAPTATSIVSSINPSVFGQPITFTATVNATAPGAGTPTGTVQFFDGATLIGSGSLTGGIASSPAISSLSVGSHLINASYGGDTNFSASYNNTLPQQVNQASTATSLVSSINPSVFGQPITFTATVNATAPGVGTPMGTVTFRDGPTVLGTGSLSGGIASSPAISSLSAGSHSINVSYGGDANFTASYNTLSQQVNQASTTSSIVSSVNPSVFGQPITFTATVNVTAPGAGTPTGTVTFRDGPTVLGTGSLSGGIASSPAISSLSAGSHSINASYGGDANFTASYNTLSQQVNQASTATSIVSSINPSVFAQPITFTATVNATVPGAGTPTGTVTFRDGPTVLGTGSLSGGIASSPAISSLSAGSHSINASFGGDANFTASYNNTLSQQVNQASTTTSIKSSLNPSVFGQPVIFTATVNATDPGAGTPTGTVQFFDGATLIGSGSLTGGIASSPAISSLLVRSHSINASYGGDTNFTASYNNTLSQQVNELTGSISGIKFEDLNGNGVRDINDGPLAGWTIRLMYPNGTILKTETTGADGMFQFSGVPLGSYIVGEVQEAEWKQTSPAGKTYPVTIDVTNPIITGRDFGNQRIVDPCSYPTTAYFASNFVAGSPQAVQFTDESTGYPVDWVWSFGDGKYSTLRNPRHVYSSPGAYTVKLSVQGYDCAGTTYWTYYTRIITVLFTVTSLPPTKIGAFTGGQWYMDASGNGIWEGQPPDRLASFGVPGFTPVVGDWNHDGLTEIGVYNAGTWYVDANRNYLWDGNDVTYSFGAAGFTPVIGDWNHDGVTEIGAFNAGTWYVDTNQNNMRDGQDSTYNFGFAGAIPVVGDWNRDSLTEIGVYNAGTWYVDSNPNSMWDGIDAIFHFGFTGAVPVTGDWNQDGIFEIGVYDGAGTWYLDADGNNRWDGTGPGKDIMYNFGAPGFIPVIGDWS
jgi:hypothetical protein